KPAGPSVTELITKALAAGGYDVEK
nr:histone H-1-MDBP-2 - chicken (fragments) [Gallus gallus]